MRLSEEKVRKERFDQIAKEFIKENRELNEIEVRLLEEILELRYRVDYERTQTIGFYIRWKICAKELEKYINSKRFSELTEEYIEEMKRMGYYI